MKVELEKAGVTLEVDQLGRQIFITEGETSTTKGFFDADEAAAAFAALVAARESDGWLRSSRQHAKERAQQAKDEASAVVEARIAAALACADPKDGARLLLSVLRDSPDFDAVIDHVVGFDDDDDDARMQLRGGGSLFVVLNGDASDAGVDAWFAPLRGLDALWLHLDDHHDHNLYYGRNAEPPEPTSALRGTAFADKDVAWFIEESPWDRFWFFVDGAAHQYEFDGGIDDDAFVGSSADLLCGRLRALLERER